MASATVFRKSGWKEWTYGHEKLIGVVLWNYESKGEKRFKYSKLLKRQAYGRTQNYKLLKAIVRVKILKSQGNGYYEFSEKYQDMIEKVFDAITILDKLGSPKEE